MAARAFGAWHENRQAARELAFPDLQRQADAEAKTGAQAIPGGAVLKCDACAARAVNRHSGRINVWCADCRLHELAESPAFFASQQAGRVLADYRRLLKDEFADNWKQGHQRVVALHEQLKEKA